MKCELYHDNFQNFKRYNIPKAQLVIADIPYNIGVDAYGFEVDKGFYEAAKEKMLAPLFAKPEFEQIGMGDVV